MTITIYHVLYNGILIGETGIKEKTNSIINDYIEKWRNEKDSLLNRLNIISEEFKDVYGPRKKDTFESYKDYIKENYPKLYEEFEKIGPEALKGHHFLGTLIASPEYYAWIAIDKNGHSHTYYIQDILMEVELEPLKNEFSIKEVEIEIP